MSSVSHCLLTATPGTTHQLISHQFGDSAYGKKIYIQAGLHADEIPAMLVALALKAELEQLERQGRLRSTVVLVTSANPIGLSQYVMGYPVGRFDLVVPRTSIEATRCSPPRSPRPSKGR